MKKDCKVSKVENKKSPFTFQIVTSGRTYLMHGETLAESEIWINAIRGVLEAAGAPLSPRGGTNAPLAVAASAATAATPLSPRYHFCDAHAGILGAYASRTLANLARLPDYIVVMILGFLEVKQYALVTCLPRLP